MSKRKAPLLSVIIEEIAHDALAVMSSSECPDTDRLADWADGSLPSSQQAELMEHVTSCQTCTRLAIDLLEIYAPVRALHHGWHGWRGPLLFRLGRLDADADVPHAYRQHLGRCERCQRRAYGSLVTALRHAPSEGLRSAPRLAPASMAPRRATPGLLRLYRLMPAAALTAILVALAIRLVQRQPSLPSALPVKVADLSRNRDIASPPPLASSRAAARARSNSSAERPPVRVAARPPSETGPDVEPPMIAREVPLGQGPGAPSPGSPTVPAKPIVAVLAFAVESGPGNVGDTARHAVLGALVQSGRFTAYGSGQLQRVLQEHRLLRTGLVDPATAVEIGKFTGAQMVICGSVQTESYLFRSGTGARGTKARATLHCKAIDTSDGSIWKEASFDGSDLQYVSESQSESIDSSSLIARAVQNAARRFAHELMPPMEGRVVTVATGNGNGYFTVNLGSRHGVTESSEFRIETSGEMVYDTDGTPLGAKRRLICLAHPIKGGVEENVTKLSPGTWRKDFLVWSWREQPGRVSEIRSGVLVIAQPRQHG